MNLYLNKNMLSFLLLAFLIVSGNIAFAQSKANPELFALMDPRDGKADFERFLSMKNVDGIAVRMGWKDLEPQDNQYNWSALDTAFASAKQHGKKLTLHIAASPLGATPQWIYDQGGKSYAFTHRFNGRKSTEPLPWDRTYLLKWGEFLGALSTHIRENGQLETLAYISSAVPVTEMSLIGCRQGNLQGYTYKRESYLKAWQYALAALNKHFPEKSKLVSAPVNQICMPDNDGRAFFKDVLSSAPKDFIVFAADLNALGSNRLNNLGNDIQNRAIGMQFIWSYTDDPKNRFKGSLQSGVCKGTQTYGAQYFEFYKQDLLNPDSAVQSVISALHDSGQCVQ